MRGLESALIWALDNLTVAALFDCGITATVRGATGLQRDRRASSGRGTQQDALQLG